jgi:hypothetical protein
MLASFRATAVIAHSIPTPAMPTIPDPQQQACGRLAKRLAHCYVALFADAPFVVDRRAGLVPPRRQAKMRAYHSRSGKAPGIIDADLERR